MASAHAGRSKLSPSIAQDSELAVGQLERGYRVFRTEYGVLQEGSDVAGSKTCLLSALVSPVAIQHLYLFLVGIHCPELLPREAGRGIRIPARKER